MSTRVYMFVVLAALLMLQGCVAVQTFPNAARAGETISLALGSLEGASSSNITITFTSSTDASTVDLTSHIRSVFNLHPDKTSRLNIESTNYNTGEMRSDVVTLGSAHSAWITVVVIDLPASLTLGNGEISILFGEGITPINASVTAEDINIGIEILPNAGSNNIGPNPFEYVTNTTNHSTGDLSLLEPMKQVLVRSPRKVGNYAFGTKVYAAQFEFTVPMHNIYNVMNPVPAEGLMVVRDVNRFDYVQSTQANGTTSVTAAQTQMSWHKDGERVVVNFISPTGQLKDDFIRFSLIPSLFSDFSSMPILVSYRYFGQDGTEISGVQPTLVAINF